MARLAVTAWGARRPGAPRAVLVHGMSRSWRAWRQVGPALARRGWFVQAVDLRGHGTSPRAGEAASLDDLARDLADTFPERPVDLLVGHSLGALACMALLRAEPGFARRLVLEDPPGPAAVDGNGMAADLLADAKLAHGEPERLRARLRAENPGWTEQEVEDKLADLRECDAEPIAAALRDGLRYDPAALARSVQVPTLLLLGQERRGSALVGREREATVAALPQATVCELEAGHSPHREAFAAFMRALEAWLAA